MTPDLSQLRDIHLPPGVSWWPPAIGWWILIALVLVCALAAYFFRRHKQAGRWRRSALQELEQLRSNQAHTAENRLSDLSVLLRRVAISRFPRSDVASLYGDAWLSFLDRTFGDDKPFQSDAGRLLSVGPYIDEAKVGTNDLAALYALSEKWIRKLPRRMKK
jgi:hypothetical protein